MIFKILNIRLVIIAIGLMQRIVGDKVTCQIANSRYCTINGQINITTEKDFIIEQVENSTDITKFELTASRLKTLPTVIFKQFPHLEDLIMNSAEIDGLTADRFLNASNLINLHLSHNKLANITAGIFPIASKLEAIYMASNHIKFIEVKSFDGLIYLHTIDLQNNSIEVIPSNAFYGLESLAFLHLNLNCIKTVEENAFNLSHLQELYLNRNQIKELPVNIFTKSIKIKEIDLEGNQLTQINWIFENCLELHTLALGNNPLIDLNLTAFSKLTSLVYLSVENTGINISAIGEPAVRSSASNIVFLNLSSNNLSDPNIFQHLTIFNKLEELQLVNNNFTHFNDLHEIKNWFPTLEYLPVIDNNNQLFYKWILNNTDIFHKLNIRPILNYD